mmetsp:Transcript_26660/g.40322  ORF Transcript_26660/g.40322 Transcript_26660/m.40322 type:complete len:151 (+) Transcript_26660:151-603(+)
MKLIQIQKFSWMLLFQAVSVPGFSLHYNPIGVSSSSLSKQKYFFRQTQLQVASSGTELSDNDKSNVTDIRSYLTLLTQDHVEHDSITAVDKVVMATTSVSLVLGFILLVTRGGGWRFYLAGGLCAAISHAVATPIDVVKVRIPFYFLYAL